MSQVNSAGISLSTSITPWNRTPGKPGAGSNNSGSFSSNRWNNSKAPSSLIKETQDASLESITDHPITVSSDGGQMWPPPVFDPSRMTDCASSAFSTNIETTGDPNQWSLPDFSAPNFANSNSLLGEPGSTTAPSCTVWSIQTSSTTCTVPRAITGQQFHPSFSSDSDPARRYINNPQTNAWTMGSDSSDFPDDRSNLPLALSKLSVGGALPSSGCFQPIQDFADGQLITSTVTTKTGDLSESTIAAKQHKKSSLDSCEVEALFGGDTEEAVRSIVNTTEPWGIHPVDQSTPWDTSDLNDASNAATCGSPSVDPASSTPRGPAGLFDSQGSTTQQPRRIGMLSGSALNRDLESNVWPSEPPNGTGIWESHYESLGERTARWQQNAGPGVNQSAFGPLSGAHSNFIGPNSSTSRSQLPPCTDNNAAFRGFTRPTHGIFSSGLGSRPPAGTLHPVGAPLHNTSTSTGSTRGFPLASSPNLAAPNGPWQFPSASPGDNPPGGANMGNKGRWPTNNFNRLVGKQQQHPYPPLLSNPNGTGIRWPAVNNVPQMQGGWPLADPRRPNLLPGGWSNSPATEAPAYFNQPHPILPPRMGQPGSVNTDFPPPVVPPPRSATGSANQPFRTPHSAFYPALNPGLSSSAAAAQRMFLSPQQHSQQLQQQSVLRANAMRQLVSLGFADEEVQAIFSDINTNVERALIDLRDRTCHPGLDEMIKSFTSSGLMQMSNLEDPISADQLQSNRPMNLRSSQQPNTFDHSLSKSNVSTPGLPPENLELSLHVLQQRETQILQTIMQLQSKHQELNGKLKQIRAANLPFATNPVMQELQLQAIQVASQVEAQHAQLKHVRSQAGMIKQITASNTLSNSASQGGPQQINPASNPGQFHSLTSSGWPPTVGANQRAPQMLETASSQDQTSDASNIQDSTLKLGSGPFFWESNPWSGQPRASVDQYSAGLDRRWSSSSYSNRQPYGALGDPRWSDVGNGDPGTLSTEAPHNFGDSTDDPNGNSRQIDSRSWLLVHNIPPHVSVGTLKLAVSNAINKHIKGLGVGDNGSASAPDFELHPHMAARWVLLGFSNAGEASAVQEFLESSGIEQNGAHYGSFKMIAPGEVLLYLQEIQSLASRFKGLGVEPSSTAGPMRSGTQSFSSSVPGTAASDVSSGVGGLLESADNVNANDAT